MGGATFLGGRGRCSKQWYVVIVVVVDTEDEVAAQHGEHEAQGGPLRHQEEHGRLGRVSKDEAVIEGGGNILNSSGALGNI